MFPAEACVTEEQWKKFVETTVRETAITVKRIEVGLLGDKEYKQKGLFERVETLEVSVEKHDRKLLLYSTGLTGLWLAVLAFKEKLSKLFL